MSILSDFFIGADGKLRAIFRALLYSVLAFWLFSADEVMGPGLEWATKRLHVSGISAGTVAFFETINLATALLLTWIFARYEGRRTDSYGFPVRQAFGARFWEGFAVGCVQAGAVALGMMVLGGVTIHGLALHRSAVMGSALAWLGANILVGIAEELLFRGYLLQTLWRAVGFFGAAVLISLWFAADHYFFKQGENVWDVITLFSLSMWVCYSVLGTGTLWLAVGYHAAFDFMQLFIIGTPNGGVVPTNHLLNATFQGPAWVTGGVLGTEASFLMFPSIVLMFLYIWVRFRGKPKI
jgi:CAAX protease family protein